MNVYAIRDFKNHYIIKKYYTGRRAVAVIGTVEASSEEEALVVAKEKFPKLAEYNPGRLVAIPMTSENLPLKG